MKKFKGKAFIFGDDIDIDEIIPPRFLNTYDPTELSRHCLQDVDPEFTKNVQRGDMIVAGSNFGSGSGLEQAVLALSGTGLSCVIARSFGRIFFRNAINAGFPILQSPEAFESVNQGDELEVNLQKGIIRNLTKDETYEAARFPELLETIVDAGGLIPAIRKGVLT
jgi:3-isopropylmalate/(R)-2-methylmalate dehydratase small subunit